MTQLLSMNNAIKSYVEQYISANRVDASSRDLTRLYATATTVGAVANLRAEVLAQIPLVPKFAGKPVEDPTHPLVRMFQPGASMTDLMLRTELTMYFWARNLTWKQRNAFQRVQTLRWINPNVYALDTLTTQGLRGFRIYPSSRYQVEPISYINVRDAVYVHGVDFEDDFDGVSDVERCFLEASIEPEMAQTVLAVFRNMAIPAAIAQPAADGVIPSGDDVKMMQNFLSRMVRGALNAGKTLISPGRWEWIRLQQPFKDMEMGAIRQDARLAICIGSRVPLELIEPSAANYAQFEGARRAWGQAWAVPRIKWYASQFTEQLAKEWGPDWSIEPDLESVEFLKEDAATKIATVNSKVEGTLITLAAAQKEIGDTPDPIFEDLYMVQGIPVPKSELPNLWRTHFAPAAAALPGAAPVPPPDAAASALPVAPVAPVEPPGGDSLCVMLDLSNNPDLIGLGNRLKALYAGEPVEWSSPDSLHITVLYAPNVTPEQVTALQAALADVAVPALDLTVGSLNAFDNLGNYALHFRVRRNSALLELQASVYDVCLDLDIPVSSYSLPANYIPHITMGYTKSKRFERFDSKIRVQPTTLLLSTAADGGQGPSKVVWKSAPAKKSAHSRSQCMNCTAPPTKDVRWAEGMGRAWFCDQHFAEWSAEHQGDIDSVHDIADGEVPVEWGGKSTPAPPASKHIPDAQWKDLKDWEAITARKGADYAFKSEALPRPIRDYIQVALADGDGPQAFIDARALLTATKSYSGTRAEFQQTVAGLIDAANKDASTRSQFAGQLRSALRSYGLMAFRDGMEEGSYAPESLSADDLTIFKAWQAESSGYVSNIGVALFKDGVTPDPEFRAELWANKSLDDIYFAGLRIGAPTKTVTWKLGSTIDHCHDGPGTFGCAERDGQTMTIDELGKIGFPGDRRLTCGGWKCDCGVFDEQGKRIGAR